MTDSFRRIKASVIDGRAQAPRYIQRQLSNLYLSLQKARGEIQNVIRHDGDFSVAEAEAEIYQTLKAVREEYEAFDFAKTLEQEYSLANSKDNVGRRKAVGCVYIIPSHHSRLYSTVQPVAAAIAAGNCVVVEIGQTLSDLSSLLRKILSETLDKDTFATVDTKPDDKDFFTQHCIIADGRLESDQSSSTPALSSTNSRTIAIVDRTSDIKLSAQEIVRARFSFCGRSPYAPDLVLVNEFVLKEFCNAAAQAATAVLAGQIDASTNGSAERSAPRKPKPESSSLKKDLEKPGVTILVSGSKGSVVHVQDRQSDLLKRKTKISEPILLVHSMRSLDDAIDFANSSTTHPYLSTYIFSNPATAKYLSQFINAHVSFTNHIPIDLLIGPAAPSQHYQTSISNRYTKEMFSTPCPEFITVSSQHESLVQVLLGDDSKETKEARSRVKAEMEKSLSPMKEPAGNAVGFFEQGLFVGMAVGLSSLVVVAVIGGRYLGPAVWKRLR